MAAITTTRPLGRTLALVGHLVGREQRIRYRRASLGMAWALAQPLVRFGIMAFVFGYVVAIDVDDYPLFLFVGIIAWTWFASGLTGATTSVLDRPELTDRPGLDRVVVPLVAIATALVDLLLALPVLLIAVAVVEGIHASIIALPVVIAVEGLWVVGLGLLTCALNVTYRDTHHVVELALAVGFYATPIVYSVDVAPESLQPWLALNPMTTIVDAYRAVLIDGTSPDLVALAAVSAAGIVVVGIGLAVYRRTSPDFGDEL